MVFYFKIVKQLSYLLCKKKYIYYCIITKNITHNLCLIFPKYRILCIYLSLFYRPLPTVHLYFLSLLQGKAFPLVFLKTAGIWIPRDTPHTLQMFALNIFIKFIIIIIASITSLLVFMAKVSLRSHLIRVLRVLCLFAQQ